MKNFIKKRKKEILIAIILVFIGTGLRLIPHFPNFVPVGALALFGGFYFSRKIALILPLTIMFISDIFIGYYEIKLMFFVYASIFLYVFIGFYLKKNKQWYTVGGGAILGAILFFLITNFAVWALTPWYQKTFTGLIQCYFMALPFFRNTLLGDLFYTTIFFITYELARSLVRKKIRVINYEISSNNSSL
jgi:hypothetical protein